MNALRGKVAVVTGGSRGIGRAVCLALAAKGAFVVVNYSGNMQAAEETVKGCEEAGTKAVAVQADVSNAKDCEALFAAAKEHFGKVDILVNNAGISRDALLLRAAESDYDAIMETNLKSAFLCSKLAARGMCRQRSGRIINMSSVVGLHGNAGQSMYATSKAGLIGLTKSLAKELASRNVTVNAIAPGFIATEMTDSLADNIKEGILATVPLGRLGEAGEVANLVCFLAGKDAGYITGQVLSIDGGMSI